MRQGPRAANIGAFVGSLLFGGAVVATRITVKDVPPLSLAVLRFGQGGLLLVLGLLVGARPLLRVRRRDLPFLALLGLLIFALFPWAFNAGFKFTEASRGSLVIATAPLWTAILARTSRREQLTRRQLIGLLFALIGVVVVLSERGLYATGNARALAGDGIILGGVLCAAVYAVLARRAFIRYSPLTVTTYTMVIGTLLLLPAALREGLLPALMHVDGKTAVLILYLGIPAGALAYFLFTFSLSRLTPTQAMVYGNLNPLTATILATIFLGERLTGLFVLGFAIVLAGVILVNWPARATVVPGGEVPLTAPPQVALD